MLETEDLGYKGGGPDGENPGERSLASTRRNGEGRGSIGKVGRDRRKVAEGETEVQRRSGRVIGEDERRERRRGGGEWKGVIVLSVGRARRRSINSVGGRVECTDGIVGGVPHGGIVRHEVA
jgi:hypothetical protein